MEKLTIETEIRGLGKFAKTYEGDSVTKVRKLVPAKASVGVRVLIPSDATKHLRIASAVDMTVTLADMTVNLVGGEPFAWSRGNAGGPKTDVTMVTVDNRSDIDAEIVFAVVLEEPAKQPTKTATKTTVTE